MTFKKALPFLLLTLWAPLRAEQPPAMAKGLEALSANLWEVAAFHFEQCLKDPKLPADQKPEVAIHLCEAWIRDGKAAEAIDLLNQSYVSPHPQSAFWRGQALASLGRFADAIASLKPLIGDQKFPYRQEAGLTVASLQLALADPQAALITLSEVSTNASPQAVSQARLRQALILLDLDRVDEADEAMPANAALNPHDQALADFTKAQILLRENRFDEAVTRFRKLIDDPKNLSISRYHTAVIGLADALNARGDLSASAELLLDFIQEQPDSPQLEAIFKRLLRALPDKPNADDPILERLKLWIPNATIPSTGLIPTELCTATSVWPTDSNSTDLEAFAMFIRAVGIHRLDSPNAKAEARHLLNRLRLENPEHFLASRALLITARWHLENGQLQTATNILETLHEYATSPLVKGEAAFLHAQSRLKQGDFNGAMELYQKSSTLLIGKSATAAKFNAHLVQLIQNPNSPAPAVDPTAPDLGPDLRLEQALIIKDPLQRKTAIEEFLIANPNHPRMGEARLNLAKTAITQHPPDLAYATAQLETIEASPEHMNSLPQAELALTRLRIDDLSGNAEKTIATARTLLADFPNASQANEASFILGRNLYQTGNYNDARITLEKLATQITDPARAQAAWLLAARSAASVPTTQSKLEAIGLFDKAITTQGSLANLAKLEKARLMIDMNQLKESAEFLQAWFKSIPENDPLHLPAGLLLGEAIYAQGNINPDSLEQALTVYDKLLTLVPKFSSNFNRIQYLRGRTLEQLPNPESPDLKREKEAFIAYYSVLELEQAPEEWEYFELCGFRALSLLEKARRWPAAIACAKKIASFNGPRASEAAARANQIQLKYMIWEE